MGRAVAVIVLGLAGGCVLAFAAAVVALRVWLDAGIETERTERERQAADRRG